MKTEIPTDSTTIQPFSKHLSLKNALKLTAKIGVSGGKVLFFVLLFFGTINFGLTVYALIRLFMVDFSWTNIGILVLISLLAVAFTVFACYLTHRYIILLSIRKIYDMTLEQRTKISEDIVQRIEGVFDGRTELSQAQLHQAVDWSKTVYHYYRAVPVFFQSGITHYLNRIPITNYIIDLKEDILAGEHRIAAEKFRISIDRFFDEHIIGSPTNIWTWLLLPVNIVILYSLITWGITAVS